MNLPAFTEHQAVHNQRRLRAANDNAPIGEACVTDRGARLPCADLTGEELALLQPLIAALAWMAMNDVSDAPLALDRKVCR